MISELCMRWYAEEHEKLPDVVHFHTAASLIISVDIAQNDIIGIRSPMKNEAFDLRCPRWAAMVTPYSDRIVFAQIPSCPLWMCHIHLANNASFWHVKLIIPKPSLLSKYKPYPNWPNSLYPCNHRYLFIKFLCILSINVPDLSFQDLQSLRVMKRHCQYLELPY